MSKVLIIVQARMGSTRLPGKVLKPLADSTVLECLISNLTNGHNRKQVIVATSKNAENDVLEAFLKQRNIICYRGAESDVLSRFVDIAKNTDADYIVRATADDPLMSGECMDILVSEMEKNGYDYAFMKGLPIGVSPEVVRRNCFDKISQNTELSDRDKEHVTIYFKEHPDEYNIGYVEAPTKYYYPNLSLTIDTEEQYLQIKELYDKHGSKMTLEKAIGELNAIK